MPTFSQRIRKKPVVKTIQIASMDIQLRNSLWNALTIHYFEGLHRSNAYVGSYLSLSANQDLRTVCRKLWIHYFKRTLDTLDNEWETTHEELRKYFFRCDWNEVYDFIEFFANEYPVDQRNKSFIESCNLTLERESSGYRFVGKQITSITSEEEIAEIEHAMDNPLAPVREHIRCALRFLSDRRNPEYRTSIKESISAVESFCVLISGDKKATLGKALKRIEETSTLHPSLKAAFDKLYGYTSDKDGIRHALLEQPNLCIEDARFMLISCSAFVNYLVEKTSKAGIDLEKKL